MISGSHLCEKPATSGRAGWLAAAAAAAAHCAIALPVETTCQLFGGSKGEPTLLAWAAPVQATYMSADLAAAAATGGDRGGDLRARDCRSLGVVGCKLRAASKVVALIWPQPTN